MIADTPHERTCIDVADRWDPVAYEIRVQRLAGAPGGWKIDMLAHDESRQKDPTRLLVLGIHSDVPDLCIGHGHDLAGVGGIRADLLIARHAGVEHDFSRAHRLRAEGLAEENRTVGERETGRPGGRDESPAHGSRTPRSQ